MDLADHAGCSQSLVSDVERGHVDSLTVGSLRTLLAAVDARVVLDIRWRGADLDRLLDADHAALVEATARRLEAVGWEVHLEVTYAIGSERGSIDIIGVRAADRAAMVIEVKSDIPAAEAVGRKLDEKGRLATAIVRARLGWAPETVAVVLVLPDTDRLRRLLAGVAAPLARMFPPGTRLVERWLRSPGGSLRATWFVSNIATRDLRARRRVRRRPNRPREPAGDVVLSVSDGLEEPPSRILR